MKWATPFKLKALMRFFQESIPVRFDNVHIVNAPLSFRVFYAALSPFVGDGFVHKLVWHKRPFRMLLATLGDSNTPTHLGGGLNLDDMKDWYQELVLAKEPIFRKFSRNMSLINL
uniref:Alpha-tocopherol transfer protein-like protein n=1 Tax=Lygus hesperus TaxID=30085 RepID=A0A0A9W8C0_LYGHE